MKLMRYLDYPLLFVLVARFVLQVYSTPLFNEATKLKDSKSVSCVSVVFINEYKKPVRIWKTMSRTRFKGFVVPGKIYKLKTMVANQYKPVVYHAEALDGDKSTQLLLAGQESISVLPFDCDDKFFNVTVTAAPQASGTPRNLISKSHAANLTDHKACLQSQGGNSDGLCCHFPFIYKGISHSTCINKDRKALWCATTNNFDVGGMWGFC